MRPNGTPFESVPFYCPTVSAFGTLLGEAFFLLSLLLSYYFYEKNLFCPTFLRVYGWDSGTSTAIAPRSGRTNWELHVCEKLSMHRNCVAFKAQREKGRAQYTCVRLHSIPTLYTNVPSGPGPSESMRPENFILLKGDPETSTGTRTVISRRNPTSSGMGLLITSCSAEMSIVSPTCSTGPAPTRKLRASPASPIPTDSPGVCIMSSQSAWPFSCPATPLSICPEPAGTGPQPS